jgi:hypothetical protein
VLVLKSQPYYIPLAHWSHSMWLKELLGSPLLLMILLPKMRFPPQPYHILEISAELVITSIVDSNRRLLQQGNLRDLAVDGSVAATVTYTLTSVMENAGFSDPNAFAASIQADLEEAYADPAWSTTFVDTAVENGASSITTSTQVTTSPPVSSDITVVEVRTAAPTASPGGNRNGDGEKASDIYLPVIYATVALIGCAIVVGLIYYIAGRDQNAEAVWSQRAGISKTAESQPQYSVDELALDRGLSPKDRVSAKESGKGVIDNDFL